MEKFDVVIIGSGPGGYVCALRCAQLGLKTAIIERYPTLGGTCLNVGCIPSKAYLDSSEKYYELKHSFAKHGISAENVTLNWDDMKGRVSKVVQQTCSGIEFLMKKNKITTFNGHGKINAQKEVTITKDDGSTEVISGNSIVLATGSKPTSLPNVPLDKKRFITSTEALNLAEVPKKLIVIGGGVIGLEMGSVYKRLGSEVQVVEYAPSIIPTMDKSLSKDLQRVLKKQGMKFFLQHAVQKGETTDNGVRIEAKSPKGEIVTFEGDYCLVAVGRKAYTENLGLAESGIKQDNRNRIEVDENLQTSLPGVYAIGDVVKGAMLAHKAEEEGVFVAEKIMGQKPHIHYNLIPGVVYTWPEVSAVGSTEQELIEKNIPYKTGEFPFKALGRARASEETDGLIKVLAHSETDEILGVHMIGPRVSDMIAQAVTAMEFRASAEDIARMSHAHPTFSEAFKEACLAATDNRALHV